MLIMGRFVSGDLIVHLLDGTLKSVQRVMILEAYIRLCVRYIAFIQMA